MIVIGSHGNVMNSQVLLGCNSLRNLEQSEREFPPLQKEIPCPFIEITDDNKKAMKLWEEREMKDF